MTEFRSFTERAEIEALRAGYFDAAMMRDHDRRASPIGAETIVSVPPQGDPR